MTTQTWIENNEDAARRILAGLLDDEDRRSDLFTAVAERARGNGFTQPVNCPSQVQALIREFFEACETAAADEPSAHQRREMQRQEDELRFEYERELLRS